MFLVPIACCGCFADWQGLPSSAVVPDWCCLGEIFRYRNKYAVRPYCPFDVVIQKHGEPAANATIFPGEFCGVDRSVAGGATGDYNGDGTAKTNPKKTFYRIFAPVHHPLPPNAAILPSCRRV